MTTGKDIETATSNINPDLLYNIPLIPVDCKFDLVQEDPAATLPLQPTIKKEARAVGCKLTVLFAIRRPGCGNCREHGLQLTEINTLEHDVSFIGAMKHGAGVDDQALLQFYQNYYRFPLFKDSDWKIYKAMGGRKLSFWKAITSIPRLEARYKKKGIPNIPFGGDIWTQGGILIFDKEGNLRHTIYETYGEELNIDEIRAAIQEARTPLHKNKKMDESKSRKSSTKDSSKIVGFPDSTSTTESTLSDSSSSARPEMSDMSRRSGGTSTVKSTASRAESVKERAKRSVQERQRQRAEGTPATVRE